MTMQQQQQPQTMAQINAGMKKQKIARLFQIAEKYGVIKRGCTFIDYMLDAIENHGWESTAITGPKGQAKSNLLKQHARAIYYQEENPEESTKLASSRVITKTKQFLELLHYATQNNERIPWVGIDDIGTIFPADLYNSDRKMYANLKKTWETLRTVINCFEFTCTRKNKVAKFILEDITGDIICYNRRGKWVSHYDYRRWLWLRSLKDPTQMIAKLIAIEDIPFPLIPEALTHDKEITEYKTIVNGKECKGKDYFKTKARLYGISEEEFKKYWNERLEITRIAYGDFEKLMQEREDKATKAAKQTEQQTADPSTTPADAEQQSNAARALANKRWHPGHDKFDL